MKIGPIPGIHIAINVGHAMPGMPMPMDSMAPTKPTKSKIAPEVMQQRLDNLKKGRIKKRFNSNIYPKPVSHNNTPEGTDLKPQPRMGYYH